MTGLRSRTPLQVRAGGFRGLLGRTYRDFGPIEDALRNALRAGAFMARGVLIRCRLARPEILLLDCREGTADEGFFSKFEIVLGLLWHHERWRSAVAGVRIDFGERGLYYDPQAGSNSWEYHFQPIDIGRASNAVVRSVGLLDEDRFASCGENLSRSAAHQLISRYIHLKPHVENKINGFVQRQFEGFHVVGVHYRGTDKWTEAPRVSYEEVLAAVRACLRDRAPDRYRLFVASDEQAFVDFMEGAFQRRVVTWETRRSTDGSPIDLGGDDNLKKGEDALFDCLLLSRCNRLIRTASHLSLCSSYFNPCLPVTLVTAIQAAPAAWPH